MFIYTYTCTHVHTHTFKINGQYFSNLFQNEKKSIEDSLCLTFFWIWVVILAFVLYLTSSCLSHFNTSCVLFCSYGSWSCSNIPTLLFNFIMVSHALHICIDEYLTTIYFLTFRWIWHCCWSWIYLLMELKRVCSRCAKAWKEMAFKHNCTDSKANTKLNPIRFKFSVSSLKPCVDNEGLLSHSSLFPQTSSEILCNISWPCYLWKKAQYINYSLLIHKISPGAVIFPE